MKLPIDYVVQSLPWKKPPSAMADPSLVQHVRRPNTIAKRPVCMVYGVRVCARVCVCVCVYERWMEGGREKV